MKKLFLLLFMFAGFSVFGQLSQNFEGSTFPPTGWITFETGTGTVQSWSETNLAVFTYGGVGKSAVINKENVATGQAIDWMVTSAVTVPANGQLRFYTKTSQTGVQGSLFNIKISTTSQTNPASFTNLISWDEASLTATENVYEEKVIDIPATYPVGSTIYIAFVMTNDNGDRWLVDNVNVVQKCNAPIGPLATALETTTSAQLSWGNPGGITAWQVEVVPFADPFTGVATYTNVTTNPFIATGLLPNTLYKFQVRSVCANGFASDWFVPSSFQTASFGDTCSGPIVVGPLPYQTVDNTANYLDLFDTAQPLSCSGSAINYMAGNDVFYSYTATFTGNIAISLSPTNVRSSIHVYSACPGTAGTTCLAGVANTTSGVRNINPFAVVAGTTYYIIISSSAAQQTVGYTLTIQQVFCYQPNAGTDGETTICEISTAPIDLFSLITGEQSGGVWTQTSGYGGVFSATAGTFTPSMGATNSTFAYTLSGTFPCIDDSSLATVNIIAQPNAGTDGGTNICETSTATIDLFSLITGEQSGGVWTQTSGSGGVFNSVLGTFTPAIGAITSTFTYTISGGTLPCIDDSSLVTVNINAQPNTVSGASATPYLCIYNFLIPITHITTGATGIGTATGLPSGVTATWAANTITISGTPTVSGIFNYTIPLTGECGTVNATGVIVVTPDNTVSPPSATPTLCINLPITPITHTTTGATGIASTTTNYGLPSGVNASWAANTITISGTPTVSGTFNYSIPLTGNCGFVLAAGTITVFPTPQFITQIPDIVICNGGTLNIASQLTSTVTGANFIWNATSSNVNMGAISGTQANIDQVVTLNGIQSGTIYIEVKPQIGSCFGTPQQIQITVNPQPFFVSSTSNQFICSESTTNISFAATMVNTVFNWSVLSSVGVSGAFNGTGSGIYQTLFTTGLSQGTVVYEVTPSANGCLGTPQIISVTVNPLPIVSLTDGYICVDAQGNPYQSYLLNTGLNNVDYIFQWFKDGVLLLNANANLNATSEGTYTVVVTNVITNCVSNAASAIVTSLYSPSSISADGTTATSVSINNGNTVQLQLNGFFGSPSNIQWTPNINISSTTISNPIVYPSTTTTYTASFINSNGCLQSTSITVNVNPLPNIGNISISTTNNSVVGLFDTITVNVQLTNATDLYSLYMKLKGNAAVSQYLDYSGYVASTLLGPLADVIATNPIVTNGEYDFGITKIGAVPGYTGSGLFYTFKFVTKNIPIPDGTVFCFYLDDVNTYNSTGTACGLTNQGQYCFTFTNQIKVWPGDLNNSNVVTTADLLPIGYFYNSTGPVRPNATIQWSGQPATLWGYNHSFLNSNAYKTFADSNGDGVINNADQAAIGFNMNQVHARQASDKPFGIAPNMSNNAQVVGALNVTPNVSIINGAVLPQTVIFTVNLTNTGGLSSLYGISTNLIFDNTIFDLSTATIDYTGSIFGLVNTDCLAINYNSATGVSVGLTRYANAAINGQGLLFKVTLKTKTTLPNLPQTQVTSYVDAANNQLGNPLEIGDSLPMNFSVINVNLGVQDSFINTFKLYPNPTKGILYFSVGDSYLDFQELKLKIVNALGQVIDQISVKNSTEEIITKNWGSSGLYFVQIETTQGEILGVKKIILQ
ncbi:choice-of-anchor J domain-containing protein [Flavobacterium sp.]|uniref:choice-of-anchor J domain-containing protein n=1 Tax=Flavobacterium sp. TaxID=239 RepID=UPI0037C13FD2